MKVIDNMNQREREALNRATAALRATQKDIPPPPMKSGVKGIYYSSKTGVWRVFVTHNKQRVFAGQTGDLALAKVMQQRKLQQLNQTN